MKKLNWGLIGGGEGSQIGPTHRMAATLDGRFRFCAGALDHRHEVGHAFGCKLGLETNRAYGHWTDMLESESQRDDRVDLVTVATPNSTHYPITKAFLEAGFHVLCEKPLCMTLEEGREIVRLAREKKRICAINFGYSGYPMVRQMRAMVKAGELGQIRLVFAEFAHGHHADAGDSDNPRVRWRYDPEQAGVSAQFADCGIHALHMATYVTGQEVSSLSADAVSCIESRKLEDDAMVNFRMTKGTVGRLWTSSVALGRQHGLTLQVFGERGGLRWAQEQPNQLHWTPLGGREQIIEKSEAGLSKDAERVSRIIIGSPEGMIEAFASIYLDLADTLAALKKGREVDPLAKSYPEAKEGLQSMEAVYAVVESSRNGGQWVDIQSSP